MNFRKHIILASIGLLLAFSASAQDPVKSQVDKFTRLLRLVDSFYVDSTDVEKLTEVAISKLLSDLDPHSVYISKSEVDEMNEPLQGSFDGIGISFNIFNDTLMVGQTIPGGPSEKVGLQAGDRILKVNNENVAGVGLTNQQVFKLLRGDKGTLVTLSIFRKGHKDILVFDIIRDKIPIYSLDAAYMLDKETAYIKLNRFSATTTDEFLTSLRKLKANNNVKGVVLDLRGNGGGFLKQAHEISDHFLPNGSMIVYTEGLKNPKKTYKASNIGDFEAGKVVVLIDGGSASASEIVAGAIQDWDRGIIIGRRSFGKGLVQQPYNLTDGSMIRLTTAHYYTPSGRCIQKPYEGGVESYRNDIRHRAESGELFNKDSISYDSSLVYYTLINKRKVYGGGGVIPDIFVPLDTSINYNYYNQLVQRSVVNQFVVSYMDQNRSKLSSAYPTFDAFKTKFEVSVTMLEEIWTEGEKKEIARNEASINFIRDHAKRHVKAIIARDLFGTGYFYEIMNADDDEIIEAIKVIKDEKRYNRILKGLE